MNASKHNISPEVLSLSRILWPDLDQILTTSTEEDDQSAIIAARFRAEELITTLNAHRESFELMAISLTLPQGTPDLYVAVPKAVEALAIDRDLYQAQAAEVRAYHARQLEELNAQVAKLTADLTHAQARLESEFGG